MRALVPSNHRHIERALAEVLSPIAATDPAVISSIWDAWRCPASMLPHLAYALSVDIWDDRWPEVEKRQAIAESPDYHALKGTRLAVERALNRQNIAWSLKEWWELIPPARRGTAQVYVDLPADEPLGSVRSRLRQAVYAAKPKSRSIAITVGIRGAAPLQVRIGSYIKARLAISMPPLTDIHAAAPVRAEIAVFHRSRLFIGVDPTLASVVLASSALPVATDALTSDGKIP
jgi:phage tail P2-like protein